jgi:ClpP class serine protease
MEQVKTSQFQQALEFVEKLPPEDQQTLIDLIQHRLVEWRRAEIARNAAATLQAVREGRAHYGSVEDLQHDLLGEP